MSDSNEQAVTLAELQHFIPATMSLYEGRLVKTETELFFIAERFSGWEIMERCELSDVQKVEGKQSFMGTVVEIHTNSSHWSLKELPEDLDVEGWIKGGTTQVSSLETESHETPAIEPVVTDSSTSTPTLTQTSLREEGPVHSDSEPIDNAELPEVYPEDIDRIRQVLTINPKMQTLISKFIEESYDGTDEQLKRVLQSRPELLSSLRNASGMKFSILRLILSIGGSNGTPPIQRLLAGCVILFFILPFLGTFLAFFVEACFR